MQIIPKMLRQVLGNRLKVGDDAKPICRVEVDKLTFVPGRIEQITIEDYDLDTEVEIKREWVEADAEGNFNATTVINTDEMIFPVKGMSLSNVTDEFGTPRGGGSRKHQGIDIALDTSSYPSRKGVGTPILAVWAGKVSTVRKSNLYDGYGMYVDIIHSNGRRTRYAHLENAYVAVGDTVATGQVIGEGGNTGGVFSGGKAVLGSYSDTESMRYKGYGSHLHFEVHESVDNQGNYKAVNPRPYLDGSKKPSNGISQQGEGVIKQKSVVGYKNAVRLCEEFIRREWYKDERYSFKNGFLDISTRENAAIGGVSNWNTLTFAKKLISFPKTTGMTVTLNMPNDGYLDLMFRTNFSKDQGDLIYVTINDSNTRVVNFNAFKGLDSFQEVNKVYVPKGEVKIDINIKWGGENAIVNGKQVTKKFSLGRIKVVDITPTKEVASHFYLDKGFSKKQEDFINAQGGYWEEKEIVDFVFSDDSQVFDLSVGDFIYTDTIELDNVTTVDISSSIEQESTEAVITISNPDGFYTSTYNPFYFPELAYKSPFSYFMGGFQTGLLSNNTPIRIYMGYGKDEIRVFTGLIDKVDIKSFPSTIVITARDMYKKISDKVLTETKQYPAVDLVDNFPEGSTTDWEKVAWLKSAVVQDLIQHAGMFEWRNHHEDLKYPDAVIEESYLISVDQATGTYIKALPGKEGEFEVAKMESTPTPRGWMNPYTDTYGRLFNQYQFRVGECINEVLKDTHYRSYCDRYGTYRLETIDYNKPIARTYYYTEDILNLDKTIDFSRARSHIIVIDGDGNKSSFLDKEILIELKGEIRTATVTVPWAKSYEIRKLVATRLFQDMKRISRSLQVGVPCDPYIDLLDRIMVRDKDSATSGTYIIKGLRRSYSAENGLTQMYELFWAADGVVI